MKKLILLFIFSTFIGYNIPYSSAQEQKDYKEIPGYIDFDNLDFFKDKEKKVEVSIKAPLLKFASKITDKENPEVSKLIENLELIKVDVYPIDTTETDEVKSIVNRISKELESKDWERMVRVKEKNEQVEIFTKFANDQLSGFVVMAVSKKEAVFVNIIGNIDPAQLGKLGGKFNIPKLDDRIFETKKK
ncbi:MAG: DUF4252 domain-containing protein [Candidatus Helarchaeota archaeon]|nr:DUF4252 domain-containing protein [Candidatus Helarchaeota archaeon]